MSRRILKNNVLALLFCSVATVCTATGLQADEWLKTGDTSDQNMLAEPEMPDFSGDQSMGPDVVLPQSAAPVATVPVSAPGENPFAPLAPSPATQPGPNAASPFPVAAPATPGATAEATAAPLSLAPSGPADAAPAAPAAKTVDETALRYYAQQRDLPRVGAEIRRLKALYPGWEPPADLFTPQTTVNEQPLWDLFAGGQYVAEHTRIEQLKSANPAWIPSADLLDKLQDAETKEAMRIAYNAGNWTQVIATAQKRNAILVCANIEALWQLGEAFARVRNYAQSFDVYKYVLVNCADPTERLSTMQKATALLPQPGIDSLVLLGRPQPDGTSEFADISFNKLRADLAAATDDDPNADLVDPGQIERFASYVRTTRRPSDIGLIGWYYYHLSEYKAAYAWFAAGSRASRDPKFIEGEILSLRGGEQTDAALKLATQVQARSPELTKQYIELVAAVLTDPSSTTTFTSEQMKAFEDIVTRSKSALGAQAVGWTYIAANDLADASTWFQQSMGWGVTEGGVIGEAVVASRLKQYGTLSSLKSEYTTQYPGLAKFHVYTVHRSSYSKRSSKCSGLAALFTKSCS